MTILDAVADPNLLAPALADRAGMVPSAAQGVKKTVPQPGRGRA